jgi:hypothetical protein
MGNTKNAPTTGQPKACPITTEVERLMKGHEPELNPLQPYHAASEDHAAGWAMAQVHLLESLIKRVDMTGEHAPADLQTSARMFLGAAGRRMFQAGILLTTGSLEAKVYEVMQDVLDAAKTGQVC